MRSLRTWLTRAIAVFFAVMVVTTIPLTLAMFQAGRVLFNPELIKATSLEVVTEANLLPRMMNDIMQRGGEGDGGVGGQWGIPITIGSGIALGASIFLPYTLFRLYADRVVSRAPPYVEQAGMGVMMRVIREIFRPMRQQSLVGVIVGLVLVSLLVLWDWRRRNRPSMGTETQRIM